MKKQIALIGISAVALVDVALAMDPRLVGKLEQKRLEQERATREGLVAGLDRAMATNNVAWITRNKGLLLEHGIISEMSYEQIITRIATFMQSAELPQRQSSAASAAPAASAAELGQQRYKTHVTQEYEKAFAAGNIQWLVEHKDLVTKLHIAGKDEIELSISALQAEQKEKAKQAERQARITTSVGTEGLMQALSPQEAVIRGLAYLYVNRVGTDEHHKSLFQLAEIKDLEAFFSRLTELADQPDIKAAIGKEMQLLRGHMLYRVWRSPAELASNEALALQSFQEVLAKRDINAAINLFRDAVQGRSIQAKVMDSVVDSLIQALAAKDIQASIDVYIYMLKNDDMHGPTALVLLDDFAKSLIEEGQLESLRRIMVCFEGTEYEGTMRDASAVLAAAMDEDMVGAPVAPSRQVYDEWQAACVNRDLLRIIQLRQNVIAQGIAASDVVDAIIASLA